MNYITTDLKLKYYSSSAGAVDQNQVVVHTQAAALRVAAGEEPSLQHLVRRKADVRHDVGRIEGRLLDLGEAVLRVVSSITPTSISG